MAEYISREAFKEEVRRLSTHYLNEWDTLGVLAAADRIPAVDVVPVRHGRWRKAVGTSGVVRMACTNCGFMRFPENDIREPMFAYCPNCGALMDKDGEGK